MLDFYLWVYEWGVLFPILGFSCEGDFQDDYIAQHGDKRKIISFFKNMPNGFFNVFFKKEESIFEKCEKEMQSEWEKICELLEGTEVFPLGMSMHGIRVCYRGRVEKLYSLDEVKIYLKSIKK